MLGVSPEVGQDRPTHIAANFNIVIPFFVLWWIVSDFHAFLVALNAGIAEHRSVSNYAAASRLHSVLFLY